MRVLATGTSSFFATRLIQGFGQLGVTVTAADSQRWSGAKCLPNVERRLRIPPPNRDPERYLDVIEQELRACHYDLLLPTFEEGLLFAQAADALRPWATLLLPPFETMWQLHHKPTLHQVCARLGLPSPRTSTPQSMDELTALLGQLKYPVVLKPPTGNNSIGRIFCDSSEELIHGFQQHLHTDQGPGAEPLLVQEKIVGQPIYTLMLCDEGRKVAEVIYRPLRTFPDDNGTSVIRESIAHPDIAEITTTLARQTNWTGFLGLDFLVSNETQTPYLIDANPRPNPAVQLGFVAGIDWSSLLSEMAQGRHPARVQPRLGVRVRSATMDWAWLLDGLKPGRGWMARSRQRLKGFRSPPWPLDARRDLSSEYGRQPCCLVTVMQSSLGAIRDLLTGRPLGQSMVENLCYEVRPLSRSFSTLHTTDTSEDADEMTRPDTWQHSELELGSSVMK